MDRERRYLHLGVRTILVTTRDALDAMEARDPLAATAARQRARHLLERLRNRIEEVDDPDLHELYAEAWRLVVGGVVVATLLPAMRLPAG